MSRGPSTITLLVVSIGGATGTILRWLIGEWFPDGSGLPATTMAINVFGSALLGLLPAVGIVRRTPWAPAFVGTGILGGFTTMSTYAVQVHELLTDGQTALGLTYLIGTIGAAVAGAAMAEHLVVRRLATASDEALVEARDGDR